jgi:hypothetical protein
MLNKVFIIQLLLIVMEAKDTKDQELIMVVVVLLDMDIRENFFKNEKDLNIF